MRLFSLGIFHVHAPVLGVSSCLCGKSWQLKGRLSGVHLAAASAILLIDQRVDKAHCALLLGPSATPNSSNA